MTPETADSPASPRSSALGLEVTTGIAVLLTMMLSALDATSESTSAAYLIGAGLAPVALVGIAYGISRSLSKQEKRRRAAIAALAVAALVLVGQFGSFARQSRDLATTRSALTEDLDVTSTSLRHPRFGFSASFPELGFARDTALEREMSAGVAARSDMRQWTFTHPDTLGILGIQIMTMGNMDERGFRRFADGVKRGMTKSDRQRLLGDSLVWEGARREYRIASELSNQGIFVRMRCLSSAPARHSAFVVCASTMSAEDDELASFRESLAIEQSTPNAGR